MCIFWALSQMSHLLVCCLVSMVPGLCQNPTVVLAKSWARCSDFTRVGGPGSLMEIFSVSTPWQDQALGQYCLEPGESHWVLCPDQLVITLEKGSLGTLHLQGTAPSGQLHHGNGIVTLCGRYPLLQAVWRSETVKELRQPDSCQGPGSTPGQPRLCFSSSS